MWVLQFITIQSNIGLEQLQEWEVINVCDKTLIYLFSHCKQNPPGTVLTCFPCGESEEKGACLTLIFGFYFLSILWSLQRGNLGCPGFHPVCLGKNGKFSHSRVSQKSVSLTLGRPPAEVLFLQVYRFISGSSQMRDRFHNEGEVGNAVVQRCWSMDEGGVIFLPQWNSSLVECLLWIGVPVSGAHHTYTSTHMLWDVCHWSISFFFLSLPILWVHLNFENFTFPYQKINKVFFFFI